MHVRVVRFSDVSPERMQQLQARVNEAGGPPPGVNASGLKVLFDEGQGTAVVLQEFPTAEDMQAAARVFEAMTRLFAPRHPTETGSSSVA